MGKNCSFIHFMWNLQHSVQKSELVWKLSEAAFVCALLHWLRVKRRKCRFLLLSVAFFYISVCVLIINDKCVKISAHLVSAAGSVCDSHACGKLQCLLTQHYSVNAGCSGLDCVSSPALLCFLISVHVKIWVCVCVCAFGSVQTVMCYCKIQAVVSFT